LDNCEAESDRTGQEIVYGWVLWEDRRFGFIEAEFHAVMRHGNTLVDITPRRDGEATVLFVPDAQRAPTRLDPRSWKSFTNIKWLNGRIVEPTEAIVIQNAGATIKEKRRREGSL